jgi:hypothetical protein
MHFPFRTDLALEATVSTEQLQATTPGPPP